MKLVYPVVIIKDHNEPVPKSVYDLPKVNKGTVTLIDVDIDAYRRKHDNKFIKKTLTIPNYLNELGKESNINFSEVLTNALKIQLENN